MYKNKLNKKKWFKKEDIPLCLMSLPAVIALFMFSYLPMSGVILAFKNYNIGKGILGSDFVGFRNFGFLFASTDTLRITRNTVLYNFAFILVNMFLAVVIALILSEIRSKKFAKGLQTVYMLPYFLSWPIVAIIVTAFLSTGSGYVNQVLKALGGAGNTNWYQEVEFWPGFIVFVNAWKSVGYSTVMYLAVISGISREYYESAALDGASKLQQARYITIPHLRFIICINLIMNMSHIFKGDFGLFYNVTRDSGPLYPVTDIIDTYVYRGLINQGNIGMSTAATLYQSVVGLVLVLITNKVVSKIDPDSAMF